MKDVPKPAPPHIVFVSNDTTAMINHRLILIRAVRAANCRCTVLGPSDSRAFGTLSAAVAALVDCGAVYIPWEVSRRGINPFREIWAIWRLKRLYARLRPDLVHHVAHKSVIYGTMAARLGGIQSVVNAVSGMGYAFTEGSGAGGILGRLMLVLHRLCHGRPGTRTILQNPDDIATLVAMGVVPAAQARLIRGSGVDPVRFHPAKTLPEEPIIVLPARMLRDKGIVEAVEAVRMLHAEGIPVQLRLVGGLDDGNPAAISATQLRRWNDEGVCVWLDHVTDMPACLRQARICCLPSYREGLPKALIEAASCGIPIVTCDVPGCREIVRDGENGLLVPPRDHVKLADALRHLVLDPGLCTRMGEQGRQMVLSDFTAEKVVDQHLAIYEELLGSHWPT